VGRWACPNEQLDRPILSILVDTWVKINGTHCCYMLLPDDTQPPHDSGATRSLGYSRRTVTHDKMHNFLSTVILMTDRRFEILELVRSKCVPVLLYGLESCQPSNADLRSLNFTFNRLLIV